ncbi:MAG TPA: hypothetical protein VJ302_12220 [Blastocatellia bacterium]|nr:hypothetical protein [Blastocatellia bacterium]
MRYQTKSFIKFSLLSAMISLGLVGCSATKAPESNLVAQSTPAPSPTVEATPIVEDLTPTPAPEVGAAGGGAAPRSNVAPAPRKNVAPTRPAAPSAPVEPPRPRTYTMPAGTEIAVSLESDLSTKKNKVGDHFTASLASALMDGDTVIAKRGAPVEGEVTESDQGGRVQGKAIMTIKLQSLTLADGRRVNISTNSYTKEAKASKVKDAAKIGGGAGIGAVIGAIAGGGKGAAIGAAVGGGAGTGAVLATRGDPAVISSESQLSFRLTSPVTVNRR